MFVGGGVCMAFVGNDWERGWCGMLVEGGLLRAVVAESERVSFMSACIGRWLCAKFGPHLEKCVRVK